MKILLFLNNDIHAATALNLILPILLQHEVKIILSKKVGNAANLPDELQKMKDLEQGKMEEFFKKIDSSEASSTKFQSFKKIAQTFGHDITFYDDVNAKSSLKNFEDFAPDLAISIRFGQIFKDDFIKIPRCGVINLHSGILPNYRGILASFWAILNGEKEIGTTLHFITDAQIDRGDIIGITKTKIDYSQSLFININRVYENGCGLLSQVIEKIAKNEKIIPQKQQSSGQYFSYPKASDINKFLNLMPLVKDNDLHPFQSKIIF